MLTKQIIKIKVLLNKGCTWAQIGDELGVSSSTAHRWYNNSSTPQKSIDLKPENKDISKIDDLRKKKYTWDQIGQTLGVAPSTAHRWYYNTAQKIRGKTVTESNNDNERISSMLDDGYTWKQIGNKLGVAPSTAHRRYYDVKAIKNSYKTSKSEPSQKKYVENLAIALVIDHFKKLGITTEPGDGTGADLITSNGDLIEVKGMQALKPGTVQVYESVFHYMRDHDIPIDKYYMYLVHDILNEPQLTIIHPKDQKWSNKNIKILDRQSFKNTKTITL